MKEDNEEALQMKSPGSHHLCSGAGQRQDDGWLPLVLFLLPRLPLPTRAEGTGVAPANLLQAVSQRGGRGRSAMRPAVPHAEGPPPVTRSKVDESVSRQ